MVPGVILKTAILNNKHLTTNKTKKQKKKHTLVFLTDFIFLNTFAVSISGELVHGKDKVLLLSKIISVYFNFGCEYSFEMQEQKKQNKRHIQILILSFFPPDFLLGTVTSLRRSLILVGAEMSYEQKRGHSRESLATTDLTRASLNTRLLC